MSYLYIEAKLGERGALKGALPGTGCLIPGEGGGLRDGGGVPSQVFFFVYPVLDLGSLRCRLSVVKFEGIPHFCVLFVY